MTLETRTWEPGELSDPADPGACLAGACDHRLVLPPLPRRAAMDFVLPAPVLWAVRVVGEEPVPQATFPEALGAAINFNLWALDAHEEGVFASPCEWPGSAREHARGLAAAREERARRQVDVVMGEARSVETPVATGGVL